MIRVSLIAAFILAGASRAPCFAGEDTEGVVVRSARRIEDPAAKEQLVDRIMAEAEQRAEQEWDAPSKENLKQGLLRQPFAELAEAARGDYALEVLMGGKALGGPLDDFVFTPVASCRALDTRPGSGIQGDGDGPLAPGTPYSFAVSMCVPFIGTKAVSINLIAVGAAGNGNLRAWPWDSALPPQQPSTAVLTYTAGFNASNGVVIPVCNWQGTMGGCVDDLFVQTNGSASHVVADLFGYFGVPRRAALDCTTVEAFLPHPAGVGGQATATATCAAGYTLTGGGAHSATGTNSMILNKLQISANSFICRSTNNQTNAHTGVCQARCCRTPGRP